MEINEIRPFFSRAYNEMRKLNQAEAGTQDIDDTQETNRNY